MEIDSDYDTQLKVVRFLHWIQKTLDDLAEKEGLSENPRAICNTLPKQGESLKLQVRYHEKSETVRFKEQESEDFSAGQTDSLRMRLEWVFKEVTKRGRK